ncbi:MAG: acyl-CoA thioester hydrolase [Anaerocolumna sp.]|jgi:acyl-CoA thioester hydrolase|nr:acyl-CoA thioester hydrolase [Anaerocolumna sp.]
MSYKLNETNDKILNLPYKRQAMYYETDQMAIIHHSNYVRWFEEARINFLDQIDLNYSKLEEMGIMIPVLSVSLDYKSSVRFNETVLITSTIELFNGVKMTIKYKIIDETTGELRTTGESKHCFVDKCFRPVHMKRDYKNIYDKLMLYTTN